MVQILPQRDIGGDIGRSLGEGLSKGLNEYIDRSFLSKGLEKLGTKQFKSPLDVAGQLYKIPGMTAEKFSVIYPLISQKLAAQQLQESSKQPLKSFDTQKIASEQPLSIEEDTKRILTPESSRILQETFIPKDPEELRKEAAELHLSKPLAYPSVQSAEEFLLNQESNREKYFNNKLQAAQRQQQLKNEIDSEFDSYLNVKLQKEGKNVYQDIPGNILTKVKAKAENDVASGKLSTKAAAEKYAQEALDFAKTRNNLLTTGAQKWKALTTPKPQNAIKQMRNAYEKVEALEEFKDDLVSGIGLSLPYASREAYPPSEEMKNISTKGGIKQTAQQILDKIKPTDSLQSIALSLKNKVDPALLLEEVQNLNSFQDKLNSRQTRELENIGSFNPSLSDIFYYTFIGKGD